MTTNSPILITGCARSGSSMIAASINLCGAFGGNMSEGGQTSKRGMFENVAIRENVIKPYLRQSGSDPMGQYPLIDTAHIAIPQDWEARIASILQKEGYKTGPWMYKDSRNCLLWPIWAYTYPEAKWVLVRRRTGDVTNSCLKTGFMKAFKDVKNQKAIGVTEELEGWLWWVHEHEKRFVEMVTEGLNCKVIWPHRMVTGDYSQLYETIDWLGLKWNDKALNFIHPLLWGNKQKERR